MDKKKMQEGELNWNKFKSIKICFLENVALFVEMQIKINSE